MPELLLLLKLAASAFFIWRLWCAIARGHRRRRKWRDRSLPVETRVSKWKS
jgi:hypothetical protein